MELLYGTLIIFHIISVFLLLAIAVYMVIENIIGGK